MRFLRVMRRVAAAFTLAAAATVFGMPSPAAAAPGGVLIVAPHPDDDLLYGAGIAAAALSAGRTVTVVFITNGDLNGVPTGVVRQEQAVVAQTTYIGTSEPDLIFLGYPDGSLPALHDLYTNPTDAFTAPIGTSETYATWGLGGTDFHTYWFGAPAPYNGEAVLQDLMAILAQARPADIYTVSEFDQHQDHATTYRWVKAALERRMFVDPTYRATLHKTIVWSVDPGVWPAPPDPAADHVEIPGLSGTGLAWGARESVRVPLAMQATSLASNPKFLAIQEHGGWSYLNYFVHRDEVFWVDTVSANLASAAAVTASSERAANAQEAVKAVDGAAAGAPVSPTREWVTNRGKAGSWLRLVWPSPVVIKRIVLYDRPNTTDQIRAATIAFSDGSTLPTGQLDNKGAPRSLSFADKTVTSLQLTVDAVKPGTQNIGLAEIEVYGHDSHPNDPPLARAGPAQTVPSGAAVQLDGSKSCDVNGDVLGYWWTQTGGPAVSLSDRAAASPGFDAPVGPVSLTFSLVVDDGSLPSGPDTVTVTVSAPGEFNLAGMASVDASSEYTYYGQLAIKAVDGVVDGYPGDLSREWATVGGKAGSWLSLTWTNPVTINRVVLYDRPNATDQIVAATLRFSDATELPTGSLDNAGAPVTVSFADKTVTGIVLFVDAVSAGTQNVGLAEIEVFGHE